jgi:CubicO group peptidase (beta-lactamase class C family)
MPVRPEDVGLSSERLARIDRHLTEHYVGPGKIAGCLAWVARRGELVHRTALGARDLARGRPMTDDTVFRIYSMTKPIVSVALMTLFEEGRFALGDPVHRFLPGWREQQVFVQGRHPSFATRPVERAMTVHDLLTHQSGLTYGFMQRTNVDAAYRRLGIGEHKAGDTLAGLVDTLGTLPLEFTPGAAWNYSVSTDVVGRLVEVISGQPLDRFLRERIFAPLGMHDTGFEVPAAARERFAACYTRGPGKRLVLEDDPEQSRWAREVTLFSGGGGLVSTAHDYLRFCEALRRGGTLGDARILSRKTLGLMTANHLPGGKDLTQCALGPFAETKYEGQGFGLGFSVVLDRARGATPASVGTYGWGGAASTIFWIDPEEELVVIFLTQLIPSRTFDFRGQLQAIVYGALEDG